MGAVDPFCGAAYHANDTIPSLLSFLHADNWVPLVCIQQQNPATRIEIA